MTLALLGLPACGDDSSGNEASSGTETSGGSSGDTGADASSSTTAEASTGAGSSSTGDTPADTGPAGPDSAPDPSVSGPYPVGVLTMEFVDPTRSDRPLVTEIWYPATDDAIGMDTVTYNVDDIFRPDAVEILGNDISSSIATTAVRDAGMRTEDGPYPVIFFSHGSGGIRMQSTYYTVDLASHGYVVVSTDHIGNTLSDIIVTGDLTTADLLESLNNRPSDLSFVREELELLEDSEPLTALMDFSRVGVTGHSFGALTSLRWMGLGADVDAVVAQAPPGMSVNWIGVNDPLDSFDTPIQIQVGGVDDTTPPSDADTVWEAASEPRARMTISNAGHFTYSDMCSLDAGDIAAIAKLGVADALDDGCTEDNTDPEVAGAIIRHYGIGFFNVYLRDSAPTLDLLTQEAGDALAEGLVTWEAEL
jgi:predicted dienelactone hydrolase